jgi:hypothetical protein
MGKSPIRADIVGKPDALGLMRAFAFSHSPNRHGILIWTLIASAAIEACVRSIPRDRAASFSPAFSSASLSAKSRTSPAFNVCRARSKLSLAMRTWATSGAGVSSVAGLISSARMARSANNPSGQATKRSHFLLRGASDMLDDALRKRQGFGLSNG